ALRVVPQVLRPVEHGHGRRAGRDPRRGGAPRAPGGGGGGPPPPAPGWGPTRPGAPPAPSSALTFGS
ncbi:hypothetical protein, partial [Nocardia abscessus]|uniref:hypothetical protein n=1 Tax=Nocardia abscessus TaxID=120957 RepID=UPI0024550302